MGRSAVTVTPRLLELIARLDDGAMLRRMPRRRTGPSTLDVLGDIAYGRKPVTILLDHSLGLDRWDIPLPPESK